MLSSKVVGLAKFAGYDITSVNIALGDLKETLSDPAIQKKWFPALTKLANLMSEISENCANPEMKSKITQISQFIAEFVKTNGEKKAEESLNFKIITEIAATILNNVNEIIHKADVSNFPKKVERFLPATLHEFAQDFDLEKWVPAQFQQCDVTLINIGEEKAIDQAILTDAENNNKPILIKRNTGFSVYGYEEKKWQETKLILEDLNEEDKELLNNAFLDEKSIAKVEFEKPLFHVLKKCHQFKSEFQALYEKLQSLEAEFVTLSPLKKDLLLTTRKLLCIGFEELSLNIRQTEENLSLKRGALSNRLLINDRSLDVWRERFFNEYDALQQQAGCFDGTKRSERYEETAVIRRYQYYGEKITKLDKEIKKLKAEIERYDQEIVALSREQLAYEVKLSEREEFYVNGACKLALDAIVQTVERDEEKKDGEIHQELDLFMIAYPRLVKLSQRSKFLFQDSFEQYPLLSACLKKNGGRTNTSIFKSNKDFQSNAEKDKKNDAGFIQASNGIKSIQEAINKVEKARVAKANGQKGDGDLISASKHIKYLIKSIDQVEDEKKKLVKFYQSLDKSDAQDGSSNPLTYEGFKKLFKEIMSKSQTFIKIVTPKISVDMAEVQKSFDDFELELEKILDEDTYKDCFKSDAWLHINNPEVKSAELKYSWVQLVAKAFLNVKSGIADLGKLEKSFSGVSEEKSAAVGSELYKAMQTASSLVTHATGVADSVMQFKKNYITDKNFLENMIAEAKKIGSPVQLVLNQQLEDLKQNRLYKELSEQWKNKTSNLNFALKAPYALLLKENNISADDKLELINTLQAIEKKFSPLQDDPLATISTLGKISFLLGNFSSLSEATNKLTQAKFLVSAELKASISNIFQRTNELFASIFVAIDRVEALLYLKEGCLFDNIEYLKQFHGYVKEFNDLVEGWDYTFKQEERFPYTHAILAAREKMQHESTIAAKRVKPLQPVDTSVTAKWLKDYKPTILNLDAHIADWKTQRDSNYFFFARKRKTTLQIKIEALEKLKQALLEPGCYFDQAFARLSPKHKEVLHDSELALVKQIQLAAKAPTKDAVKQIIGLEIPKSVVEFGRKQKAIELIDARIAELEKELKSFFCWGSSTKKLKIDLLRRLRANLLADKTVDESIEAIREDKTSKEAINAGTNFHLLFDGRTAKMMEKIQFGTMSKEQMCNQIDIEIERLKQRKKQGFWFFAKSKTQALDDRIGALELLKTSNKMTDNIVKTLKPKDSKIIERYGFWSNGVSAGMSSSLQTDKSFKK